MPTMAASSSSMRSSTSFCFIAAIRPRMVSSRAASLARMAAFMSSVMRSFRLIVVSRSDKARRAAGFGDAAGSSVELLGQLHAANALEMALDGRGLLALALGGGLLVELAGAQVGQQPEFLDR